MPPHRVFTTADSMGRTVARQMHRPRGFGEQWFNRALPRVAAGGIASIHWWGDSISVGDDASSVFGQAAAGSNTTAQKDAWRHQGAPGVLRLALQAEWGDAGEGFQPFGLAVTTGTWTSRLGAGMSEARATAAASATWKVFGTTVHIWHRNALVTGSFRYQVDGGGFTTVTPPTDFGADPGVVVISGLSNAEHTIRVEWVSGTIGLNGVRGIKAGPGIRLDRFAQHGAAATELGNGPLARRQMSVALVNGSPNITAGAGGYFTAADIGSRITGQGLPVFGAWIGTVPTGTTATLVDSNGVAVNATATATNTLLIDANKDSGIATGGSATVTSTLGNAFTPNAAGTADLVIVALSANDAAAGNRGSEVTFRDAYSRLTQAYTSASELVSESADFVFVLQHVGKWFNVESRYAIYSAALKGMAEGMNAAVIDMWQAGRRSYGYAQQQRLWAGAAADNQVHISRQGHAWLGEALTQLLVA